MNTVRRRKRKQGLMFTFSHPMTYDTPSYEYAQNLIYSEKKHARSMGDWWFMLVCRYAYLRASCMGRIRVFVCILVVCFSTSHGSQNLHYMWTLTTHNYFECTRARCFGRQSSKHKQQKCVKITTRATRQTRNIYRLLIVVFVTHTTY